MMLSDFFLMEGELRLRQLFDWHYPVSKPTRHLRKPAVVTLLLLLFRSLTFQSPLRCGPLRVLVLRLGPCWRDIRPSLWRHNPREHALECLRVFVAAQLAGGADEAPRLLRNGLWAWVRFALIAFGHGSSHILATPCRFFELLACRLIINPDSPSQDREHFVGSQTDPGGVMTIPMGPAAPGSRLE
jgi:hypothetical protein